MNSCWSAVATSSSRRTVAGAMRPAVSPRQSQRERERESSCGHSGAGGPTLDEGPALLRWLRWWRRLGSGQLLRRRPAATLGWRKLGRPSSEGGPPGPAPRLVGRAGCGGGDRPAGLETCLRVSLSEVVVGRACGVSWGTWACARACMCELGVRRPATGQPPPDQPATRAGSSDAGHEGWRTIAPHSPNSEI